MQLWDNKKLISIKDAIANFAEKSNLSWSPQF